MTSRGRLEAVQLALREALTVRLAAVGWAPDLAQDVRPTGRIVAVFRCSVEAEFSAVLRFERVGGWSSEEPTLDVGARVSVDFEPVYRLSPFLLGEPSYGECDLDASELSDPSRNLEVTLSDLVEVGAAVDELTAIQAAALDYARAHATVEDLLGAVSCDPDLFYEEITAVPLLLAAAGRRDEALAAVTRYLATGEEEVADRDYQRFVRRLRWWFDDGAVLPDPPTGPVIPRRPPTPDPPSLGSRRQHSRRTREAFEAVKRESADKSDDQLREMLRQELAGRDVTEGTLWVESAIDAMHRTPLGQVQAAVQGLATLATTGVRVINVLRGRSPDLPDTPEWLGPPPEAAYPMRCARDEWVAVELSAGSAGDLDRVHKAGRRVLNTAMLDAWLSWEADPPKDGPLITVHLGSRPVGVLTRVDTARYTPAMVAAEQHHELPFTGARLTRLDHAPHYLLEIRAPADPS